MRSHADVEEILACICHHILVASNSTRFKSFTGDLLPLIGDHVHCSWELITWDLLLADFVNANFGIRHTSAESRFWERLVLAVPIALCRASSHVAEESNLRQ